MCGRTTGTRGQSLPLVALLLWLIAAVMVMVTVVGERTVTRSRAQAAADAAALAASGGGDASLLAARNGATIARTDTDTDDDVDVVTAIGDVTAAARAARSVDAATAGLDPRLVGAIAAAEVLLGEPVPIVSGFRRRAEQELLWAQRATNPYPVAPPGTSLHELGLAIDVPATFAPRLAGVAGAVGLCRPLAATDPIHFVLCGA